MKNMFLAAAALSAPIFIGGTLWAWQSSNAEPTLTETVLANRDHTSLLVAIDRMCSTDNSVAVADAGSSAMVLTSLRAPSRDAGTGDMTKLTSKPTTFQMSAVSYSGELRDQRIRLDQRITREEAMSWWFKVAIALCGGFATMAVGLKPLIERAGNVRLDTSIAAAAIIFTGTVGTLSGLDAFAQNTSEPAATSANIGTASAAPLAGRQRCLCRDRSMRWQSGPCQGRCLEIPV